MLSNLLQTNNIFLYLYCIPVHNFISDYIQERNSMLNYKELCFELSLTFCNSLKKDITLLLCVKNNYRTKKENYIQKLCFTRHSNNRG